MRARDETIQLLTDYYAAIEANRPEDFARFYAEDVKLTLGNLPAVTGRDQVVATFSSGLNQVRSLAHELINVWEEDDDIVILETIGTWTKLDGTQISVPAVGVFTVVDGKFTEQRITVDNGPVFGGGPGHG